MIVTILHAQVANILIPFVTLFIVGFLTETSVHVPLQNYKLFLQDIQKERSEHVED